MDKVVTAIPTVPVTEKRRVWKHHSKLREAGKQDLHISQRCSQRHRHLAYAYHHPTGVARANIAPSEDHPEGTTENNYAAQHENQTV